LPVVGKIRLGKKFCGRRVAHAETPKREGGWQALVGKALVKKWPREGMAEAEQEGKRGL